VQAAVDRLAGYRQALAENGVAADEALIVEGDFSTPSGYTGARRLMALREPPTAIFAGNDAAAFGVMDALRDLGLRIPQDVSVLGCDDVRAAAESHPALTTIRQPLAEMGATAVSMLLDLLNGQALAVNRAELATRLIVRQSCAPPPVQLTLTPVSVGQTADR
jgi:LacI family transcriptional regulator